MTVSRETKGEVLREYPEVMTVEEVAGYLHLHKQVVYRHVRAGTIPASRIGATLRFKKSVIDAWLEDSALRSLRRERDRDRDRAEGGTGEPAPKPVKSDKFVWE